MAAGAAGAAGAANAGGASSLQTAAAGLNVVSSISNIIATPFNMQSQIGAAKTEARNAAATAKALTIERDRTLGIFDRESRALAAEQTASYIMSGVQLSGGTATATMTATREEREADRRAINANYNMQIANAYAAEKAAKKQAKNAGIGGIAQIAGAAIGLAVFSDERLKQNLVCVGRAKNGLKIYLGRYTKESGLDDGHLHLFLIAQEVQKIRPEAVKKHESGFLMVDYAAALL